jgi:hypothetical protein
MRASGRIQAMLLVLSCALALMACSQTVCEQAKDVELSTCSGQSNVCWYCDCLAQDRVLVYEADDGTYSCGETQPHVLDPASQCTGMYFSSSQACVNDKEACGKSYQSKCEGTKK